MGSENVADGFERVSRSRTSVYGHRRVKGVHMPSSQGRRLEALIDDLSSDLGGLTTSRLMMVKGRIGGKESWDATWLSTQECNRLLRG
jgi:hypothetical protein